MLLSHTLCSVSSAMSTPSLQFSGRHEHPCCTLCFLRLKQEDSKQSCMVLERPTHSVRSRSM